MMVFYSKPLIALALALKAKGMDPSLADRSSLDFRGIREIVMEEVSSFIGIRGLDVIAEVAHSGLGLGYHMQTETQ